MKKYKYNHDCPFEAFIVNLCKYTEGDLVGEWVKFPTTVEDLEAVFKRIGIGSVNEFGQPYEEWFIPNYSIYFDGIDESVFGECANIDELNYLASRINELGDNDLKKLTAIICEDKYSSDIANLINTIENFDSFDVYLDVKNTYDLGYYYLEEAGIYDLSNMGYLRGYINYEQYGREMAQNESGVFTNHGYVYEKYSVSKIYRGFEDIPDEYKVLKVKTDKTVESYKINENLLDNNKTPYNKEST